MTEIDPVEFGKLVESLNHIKEDLDTLRDEVKEMNEKISKGKGVLLGVLVTAGGLGAGASELLSKIIN